MHIFSIFQCFFSPISSFELILITSSLPVSKVDCEMVGKSVIAGFSISLSSISFSSILFSSISVLSASVSPVIAKNESPGGPALDIGIYCLILPGC